MKVGIKKLAVEMDVKNRGVEFEVRNSKGEHLGDLIVKKSGLVWCRGRTTPANGIKIKWEDFIANAEAE